MKNYSLRSDSKKLEATYRLFELAEMYANEAISMPLELEIKTTYDNATGRLESTLPVFFSRWKFPVQFEFQGFCQPVDALGCDLLIADSRLTIKRFQPRDGDGPGWTLLEEVVP